MVFSSATFIFMFLPITLMLYFVAYKMKKTGLLNLVLLLASIVFYGWGGTTYLLILIAVVAISYFLTILMSNATKYKTVLLILILSIDLGNLFYFKYFNFFVSNTQNIANHFNLSIFSDFVEIVLPIGISFYTFQILSYVIDLYRKEIKVQKNIINLALYVSFFPQLIAGPIVKYKDIEKEISDRKTSLELFASGVKKFVYGLGKKVIFANSLALVVDSIYAYNVAELNTPIVWLAAISYTLQIYFDFSGYSDMAIGLGRMFGFHFQENFNLPYISQSITEFWRRWHISLSTWFKQYLYIPLGGNRKGKIRTYINLLVVFFATGLWHGASWNFVVWGGLFYGSILVIERLFLKNILDNNKHKILNSIYVLLIVIIGWVIFRADGLRHALSLIKMMFSFDFKTTYVLLPTYFSIKEIIIIILSIFLCGFGHNIVEKLKCKDKLKKIYEDKLEIFVIILILAISITELVSSTYNPFIYFRF